ncbi:MAG: TfoX/Sxy family DNA transformation protein [Mariniblastus sp.]
MAKRKDIRKISEMRNLGPACEKDLNAAGIHTAEQVIKLGVEGTFIKMLNGRLEKGRSASCCNAAYLYAIHGAIHDIDWRGLPEKKKNEYKSFAAELRESGRYAKS